MKQILLRLVLLVAMLGAGCRSHYQLTLNNGGAITAYSKPKLVSGAYVFKDANGQETQVSAGRVRAIDRK